jgi:succinate-semialdehyde dehydrogenase/glutarate-semialdehyde dehydrogenase
VQEGVYDQFAHKLAIAMESLQVGNGLEDGSNQGPLINHEALLKIEEHVADAKAGGASVSLGGARHSLGGTFYQPTLLTGVTSRMKVANEETFGPLAPLFAFKTEEEGVALANNTPFGLASYFYAGI